MIEFLYDFGSPASFVAHRRLAGVVARTGAAVDYVPVLLGGIFKATGNVAPATLPAKGAWLFADLGRYAAREGLVLDYSPSFPINTVTTMRIAAGLRGGPDYARYVATMFDAMWLEACDLANPAAVRALLDGAGFDAEALLALAGDDAVKARLRADTDAAVARGVFGCPTFFVDGVMHFGQDRLDWVEAAVAA